MNGHIKDKEFAKSGFAGSEINTRTDLSNDMVNATQAGEKIAPEEALSSGREKAALEAEKHSHPDRQDVSPLDPKPEHLGPLAAETTEAQGAQPSVHSLKQILTTVEILTEKQKHIAKRDDLKELHGRVVKLFTTLNEGLSESQIAKTKEDRLYVAKRISGLEESVNKLEGAVRIEFQPIIENAIKDAITEKLTKSSSQRGIGSTMFKFAVFLGLIGGSWLMGAWQHTATWEFINDVKSIIQ